jgi:hypothetical protein
METVKHPPGHRDRLRRSGRIFDQLSSVFCHRRGKMEKVSKCISRIGLILFLSAGFIQDEFQQRILEG